MGGSHKRDRSDLENNAPSKRQHTQALAVVDLTTDEDAPRSPPAPVPATKTSNVRIPEEFLKYAIELEMDSHITHDEDEDEDTDPNGADEDGDTDDELNVYAHEATDDEDDENYIHNLQEGEYLESRLISPYKFDPAAWRHDSDLANQIRDYPNLDHHESLPYGENSCCPEHQASTTSYKPSPYPDQGTHSNVGPAPPSTTAPDVLPVSEPQLCPEQEDLVNLIMKGENVFYTGSAGCGKSTVLKAFVKRKKAIGAKVNIVAPTGRAALDINGQTTWTYAGWTPDTNKKSLNDVKKNAHGKYIKRRLQETDVLVIDEISMVENFHFERLNVMMKEARDDKSAFGGVQLIVTGDFCQLPPVQPFKHCYDCGRELSANRTRTEYKCAQHGVFYDIDKWAFRSKAWEECKFVHVNLQTIHRQSDRQFIDILNKLRMGTLLGSQEIDLLLNHESNTRNAIKLFATRLEVKQVNDEMFRKLPTQPRLYQCLDHFEGQEHHANLQSKGQRAPDGSLIALREHRYEPQIQLKKGMLVVLLSNIDVKAGLVNGSQGIIQGFEEFEPGKLPKSTVGKNRDNFNDSMDAPTIGGDHAMFREMQVQKYMMRQEQFKKLPIVAFVNGITTPIFPDCTVNELGDRAPYSLLSRTQIPLMAAWALTMHKAQGMTLNRVIVDLSKSFEQGQAYVALSRARSLDGLLVKAFPKTAQGTGNKEVKDFLKSKFNL